MMDRHRTTTTEQRRSSLIAAAIYAAVLLIAVTFAASSLASLVELYGSVSTVSDRLAQMERRVAPPPAADMPKTWPPDAPQGSPFLEGDTMTVAGAGLLQRVTGAVGRVGGIVVSSQVELQAAAPGRIGLVLTAEMSHAALQEFLYDIEGGMPFLFVEQLHVQAPGGTSGAEGGNSRLTMSVQGQWRNAR